MVIHQFRPIASGAEMQVERLAGKLIGLVAVIGVIDFLGKTEAGKGLRI